jgi:hypothetical protein
MGYTMIRNTTRLAAVVAGAALAAGSSLALATPAFASVTQHGAPGAAHASYPLSGGWGWDDDREGDRVAGFFHSYRQCQRVGYFGTRRGDWDDFSCDYTRRGWDGWSDFSRFGDDDWRCRGTWVLRVDDYDED